MATEVMKAAWRRHNAKRRKTPAYRLKQREWHRRYREAHRDDAELHRKWAERQKQYRDDPEKRAAHMARWLLNRAVAARRIVHGPCEVCGALKTDGHHDDYAKPLEVHWLCRQHHTDRHA